MLLTNPFHLNYNDLGKENLFCHGLENLYTDASNLEDNNTFGQQPKVNTKGSPQIHLQVFGEKSHFLIEIQILISLLGFCLFVCLLK